MWKLREMGFYHADLPETPSTPDGPCVSPLVVWDAESRAMVLWPCRGHRASRCASCAAGYRRKVGRIAGTGCLTRFRSGGHLGLLTLNAPGNAGHRRWVVGGRAREVCDCDASALAGLGVWNRQASYRWNRLRTALRREYPGCEFFRAVEVQKRGALHLHVIFWSPTPVVPQRLQELALTAGFGCVLDWSPARDGEVLRFAGYVSKYVTKATDSRGLVPWEELNPQTGELVPTDATYRTWSQSKSFGCTMKEHETAIRAERARRAERLRETFGLLAHVLGAVVIPEDDAPDLGGTL